MSFDNDDDEIDFSNVRPISRETGLEKKAPRGRGFQPGQVSNPRGRPPGKAIADIRSAARQYSGLALETLVEIMLDPYAPAAPRVVAANSILNRGHGMPQQRIEIEDGVDFARLDDAELDEIIRKEIKAQFVEGPKRTIVAESQEESD